MTLWLAMNFKVGAKIVGCAGLCLLPLALSTPSYATTAGSAVNRMAFLPTSVAAKKTDGAAAPAQLLPPLLPAAKNSESHLQPDTIFNLRLIEWLWPYFREGGAIYGWRPDPIADHPSGQALDVMVPDDGRSLAGLAMGNQVAAFMMANYQALGVDYLVWRQHIWHPGQSWRLLDDRGDWTQNHMNHVHVKVFGDHVPDTSALIMPNELNVTGMDLPDGEALRAAHEKELAARQKVAAAQARLTAAQTELANAQKANTNSDSELTSARKTVDQAVRQAYMLGMDSSFVTSTLVLSNPGALDPTAIIALEHQLNSHQGSINQANQKLTNARTRVAKAQTEAKAATDALSAALTEQSSLSAKKP